MIKGEAERLAIRRKEFESLLAAEKRLTRLASGIAGRLDTAYVHTTSISLYLHPGLSAEELEESGLLGQLSAAYGEMLLWKRTVENNNILYRTSFPMGVYEYRDWKGKISSLPFMIYLVVGASIPGTCQIIVRDTGKKQKERKYYEVDVPVTETLIDCGE